MLTIQNLRKEYSEGKVGHHLALDRVNLHINQSEFCALTGPSGSGKTTLMNLIGLLDRPTAGTIRFGGLVTDALIADQVAELRNRFIGFVFQSFHLLPRYTALDNVCLPLIYRGIHKRERRAMAATALEQVGLTDRMMHRPDELSGGQRQRVAIARALVGKPSLLLADEPTGNLDSRSAEAIMSLFLRLNDTLGLTIIIVTHDPQIAARCPRRIEVRDGQIVEGSASAVSVVRG
ncbi:ABC transporter ATP-binding protein [Rhizobium sp. AG855]|uniref:ABC transporter ATP-binding protein n=1 Tax=Rhizobium sp. AG855 TaxID=2183898 RepID=UPI000E70D3F2|nr:ABC transporter ATP-binding protein [Rhizobium sp. AG855]RKE76942.1 putative ABC transport system ATP-binding protein [Rhizobium sp. AG855]